MSKPPMMIIQPSPDVVPNCPDRKEVLLIFNISLTFTVCSQVTQCKWRAADYFPIYSNLLHSQHQYYSFISAFLRKAFFLTGNSFFDFIINKSLLITSVRFLKCGLQYKKFCSDQDLCSAMQRTVFITHAFHLLLGAIRLISIVGPFLWYYSLGGILYIILLPPFQR